MAMEMEVEAAVMVEAEAAVTAEAEAVVTAEVEGAVIIQTLVKLWNKSKESSISRSKTKQRVSSKVPPNNQESIDVYQCYMQRVYNRSRTLIIKEPSIKKQGFNKKYIPFISLKY
jgi:hypothetical protein